MRSNGVLRLYAGLGFAAKIKIGGKAMAKVDGVGHAASARGRGRQKKIDTADSVVAELVNKSGKLKSERAKNTAKQERTLKDRRGNLNEALRAKKENSNLDPSQRTGDVDFTTLVKQKNIKSQFSSTDHTHDDDHLHHPGKGKGKGMGKGGIHNLRNELHNLRHSVDDLSSKVSTLSSTTTVLIQQNNELIEAVDLLTEENTALQDQNVALMESVAANTEALIDLAKKIVASGLGSPFTGAPQFDPNASSTEQLQTAANATNQFTGSLDLKSVEQSSNTGGDEDSTSGSLTETLQARLGALLTKLEDNV